MINKNSTYYKKLLLILLVPVLILTLASCGGQKQVETLDRAKTYIKVGNETVTQGELYNELRWKSSKIIDDKRKELFLHNIISEIGKAIKDDKNEKHTGYLKQVQRTYIREVLKIKEDDHLSDDIKFNIRAENYEWRRYQLMNKNEIELHVKDYYDENFFKGLKLEKEEVIRIFKDLDYDEKTGLFNFDTTQMLEEFETIYVKVAENIFNLKEEKADVEKSAREKKEYFDKSKVVKNYYAEQVLQGDYTAFLVDLKGLQKDEILKKFGIKESNKLLYFLKTGDKTPQEYESYINNISEEDLKKDKDSINIETVLSKSFILQLYIGIYNYLNPFREKIENLDFTNVPGEVFTTEKDAPAFTEALYKKYYKLIQTNTFDDDKRAKQIYENIAKKTRDTFTYTREELNDKSEVLYKDLFKEHKKEVENQNKAIEINNTFLYYYIDYVEAEEDKDVDVELREEQQYELIKNNQTLYNKIIDRLKEEEARDKLKESRKLSEKIDDVNVKIYDKEVEIAFHREHTNYSRTLSQASTNNIIASLEYKGQKYEFELYNKKDGLYDQLEKEFGFDVALDILAKRRIKQLDIYKNIPQKEIDGFKEKINRELELFIGGQLSVSAKIGKRNYLMTEYHTDRVDEIIDNFHKITYVKNRLFNNFKNDDIVDLYLQFANKQAKKHYPNQFSVIQVMLDKNEDGIPDEITNQEEFKREATELLLLAQDYLTNNRPTDIDSKDFAEYYKKSSMYKYSNEDTTNKFSKFKVKGYKVIESYIHPFEKKKEEGPEEEFKMTDNYDVVYKKFANLLLAKEGLVDSIRKTNNHYPVINKQGSIFDISTENLNNTSNTIYTGNKLTYLYYVGSNDFTSDKLNFTYREVEDQNELYKNKLYIFNKENIIIDNLYSETNEITLNQTKAYLIDKANANDPSLPDKLKDSTVIALNEVYSRFEGRLATNEINLIFILGKTLQKTDITADGVKSSNITFRDKDLETHYTRYKNYLLRNEIYMSNDQYIIDGEVTAYNNFVKTVDEFYYDLFQKEVN